MVKVPWKSSRLLFIYLSVPSLILLPVSLHAIQSVLYFLVTRCFNSSWSFFGFPSRMPTLQQAIIEFQAAREMTDSAAIMTSLRREFLFDPAQDTDEQHLLVAIRCEINLLSEELVFVLWVKKVGRKVEQIPRKLKPDQILNSFENSVYSFPFSLICLPLLGW